MIQPLRTVHRRASIALAVLLPTLLFIGLMARQPLPHVDQRIPYSVVLDPARKADHVWTKQRIHSSFFKNPSDPIGGQVVLHTVDELSAPDLLVYWSSKLPDGDSLPKQALLIEALGIGKVVPLPSTNGQGFLILYSLAHQSIVDTAPVESLR